MLMKALITLMDKHDSRVYEEIEIENVENMTVAELAVLLKCPIEEIEPVDFEPAKITIEFLEFGKK
jgi:hypothetical protein